MTEKPTRTDMPDEVLDMLLSKASRPVPMPGFEARLMDKIAAESNVVAFTPKVKSSPWLVGLPLAACLMIGIALGTQGIGTDTFGLSSGDELAALEQTELSTGLEEAELTEEDLS